jgi:UDP-arabinose 4-epimerase
MSEIGGAVLVAGGAGYIGSHTVKQLHASGMRPVVVDNLITGNRFALRYGPFIEGSIEDKELIRRAIEVHGIRSAILFAAHAYVGESTTNPRKYYHNNVSAALSFLDALLDGGVRRLVFSSSCSIYGIQEKIPISESSSKNPLSPYAETKLFMEQVLHAYGAAYGLRSACLRYFNAAGADPDGELGEHHDPETHLIPLAIYAAMGRKPLSVFGTDYPTPDGTAIRDYIHVTDLAAAHIAALKHLEGGGENVGINLGTGTGHSVRQVMQMVEQVSGLPVPANYGPRRDGDAPALVADAASAVRVLNWTPRYSSLDSIVGTAWKWHSERETKLSENPQASKQSHD